MKHNYSSYDIERAVEQAEARGLDEFMSKDPRGGKQTTDHFDTRESKVHTDQKTKPPRRSIFDDLMFGSRSPKNDELISSSSLITSSMDLTGDILGTDDLRTCNPCEEVREIVKGIREGKYTLRSTGFEEDLDDTFQPTRQSSGKNLRLPKHWRSHQVDPSDGFKYHETYWDGGNMAALRMTNKEL
ncbi:hypothetical protein SAMN05192533_110151 [Mesobacillus persicus]|uniref:Uncharacterized protein n=1 Tax=Mesobacillus persicus TaxID=930146 RepID=A0A1H8EY12_9BACI|nr:hypothetical protein [Mesobacillus persicus]SEN24491.1 hypothetical protein SAMN05192533_110151 [Mesobacillus persicus]